MGLVTDWLGLHKNYYYYIKLTVTGTDNTVSWFYQLIPCFSSWQLITLRTYRLGNKKTKTSFPPAQSVVCAQTYYKLTLDVISVWCLAGGAETTTSHWSSLQS